MCRFPRWKLIIQRCSLSYSRRFSISIDFMCKMRILCIEIHLKKGEMNTKTKNRLLVIWVVGTALWLLASYAIGKLDPGVGVAFAIIFWLSPLVICVLGGDLAARIGKNECKFPEPGDELEFSLCPTVNFIWAWVVVYRGFKALWVLISGKLGKQIKKR